MRVQLSPWEITRTSFRRPLSTTSRDQSTVPRPLIVGCFVEQTSSSLRSRKKRKTGKQGNATEIVVEEDRLPVLTISSAHRVAVLVENKIAVEHINGEVAEKNGFEESSLFELTSRPGKLTAFIPESSGKDNKKPSGLPIPAVFDAQRNRIYALQKNNAKLMCYDTTKLSGTDIDISLSVDLDTPALSLSLLHLPRSSSKSLSRCIAYGTCQDARIFVASLTTDKKPSLIVEYFKTKLQLSRGPVDHVGTLAFFESLSDGAQQSKRKLESDVSSDECDFVVYQIVQQAKGVLIVHRKIRIDPYVTKGGTWASILASGFEDVSPGKVVSLTEEGCVSDMKTLGFVEELGAIAISYTTRDERSFYTSIVLRTGTAIGSPILLPCGTRQVGLIGPSLLAVLTTSDGTFSADS